MAYELKEPFWIIAYEWQTLIAGIMALVAGFGTVWATISAAGREITAAQAQTTVAQEQIATTLRIERRRIASEAWAFYAALEAAMATVTADVEIALGLAETVPQQMNSVEAYAVRQRISKSMFPELRAAMLRLGGQLTATFIEIDDRITRFSSKWILSKGSSGVEFRMGERTNLSEELGQIGHEAYSLRAEAAAEVERCSNDLAEIDRNIVPETVPERDGSG